MTCSATTLSAHSLPAPSTPHARGIAALVKGWWAAYWRRRAQRTTVLMLEALDDQTLRDIGLGRSEIGSLVYGEPHDRMQRYHTRWE